MSGIASSLIDKAISVAGKAYDIPIITSAERVLTKDGSPALQAFVGLVKDTFMHGEQYKGKVLNVIKDDVEKVATKDPTGAATNAFHEHGIVPKDVEVGLAAVKQKNLALTLRSEAQARGIKVQPLVGPNYLPSMVKDDLVDTAEGRQKLIDHFVANGKTPKAAAQALGFIQHNGETPLSKTFHPFESPRRNKLDPSMLRKDLGVYPDYLLGAAERIGRADVAGPYGEKLQELLEVIRGTDGQASYEMARRLASEKLGTTYMNHPESGSIERGIKAGIAMTTLHLAPIANTTGGMASMVTLMGLKTFAKGFSELVADREASREFTNEAGPALYQVIKNLKRVTGAENQGLISKLSSKVLMNPSENMARNERWMRELGAVVGKNGATSEFEKLLRDPSNTLARRRLNVLGIDVDSALRRGSLDSGDLTKAAYTFSNKSMLTADAFSTPELWRNSPFGRIMTMYKPFLFLQTKFVRDEILKPALGIGMKQDLRPLLWAAVAFPTLGEIAGDIKSLARGRGMEDRPDFGKYPADRILDNISQVGGVGMAYDVTNAMAVGSPVQTYSFLNGPVISTGVDLATLLRSTSTSKQADTLAKQRASFLLRKIPVIGSAVTEAVVQPKHAPTALQRGVVSKKLGLAR